MYCASPRSCGGGDDSYDSIELHSRVAKLEQKVLKLDSLSTTLESLAGKVEQLEQGSADAQKSVKSIQDWQELMESRNRGQSNNSITTAGV